MPLKPKRNLAALDIQRKIDAVARGEKLLTEDQLAEIFGISVKDAVKKAAELGFSRIPVKGTHYYSRRQVQSYLNGEVIRH